MTDPKQPPDHPPAEGTAPDHNPTGKTPHGVPEGIDEHEATGLPNSDRQKTETVTQQVDKD